MTLKDKIALQIGELVLVNIEISHQNQLLIAEIEDLKKEYSKESDTE